ncbi:MAG: ATP-grasp domain-containing protein [Microcystaceae cyanobacterium]
MLTNIRLWIAACRELNIAFEILHPTQNLVRIKSNNKFYFFINYSTPFNIHSNTQLFKDKEYSYQLLKERVNIPKTRAFLSPFCAEKYQSYLNFKEIDSILKEISKTFAIPVIIKRNAGSAGNNVFLCQDIEQVKLSLQHIFNVNSKDYDYIALAQEYIDIDYEYRAFFFNDELLLLYKKSTTGANFVGNLSPLHWKGSQAIHITEANLLAAINSFIQPIFQEITLNYAGVDIAIDKKGKYWLIEINSSPIFDLFIRDNNEKIIIEMFKKMLKSLD